jgi:hypothetical protein
MESLPYSPRTPHRVLKGRNRASAQISICPLNTKELQNRIRDPRCDSLSLPLADYLTDCSDSVIAPSQLAIAIHIARFPTCQSYPADEAPQGGDAALSCRLCLIACNSRHSDEVGVPR